MHFKVSAIPRKNYFMNNLAPFTLRIFVADGDPDGLRLVERSNWIGKAVMFPRAHSANGRNSSKQVFICY